MSISREEVLHVARLARVGLTEDDVTKFTEQLSDILENFAILRQVDTSDVPPTTQAIPLQNVMKPDEPCPSLPPDKVLANAPEREEGFFRIKPVLKD